MLAQGWYLEYYFKNSPQGATHVFHNVYHDFSHASVVKSGQVRCAVTTV